MADIKVGQNMVLAIPPVLRRREWKVYDITITKVDLARKAAQHGILSFPHQN